MRQRIGNKHCDTRPVSRNIQIEKFNIHSNIFKLRGKKLVDFATRYRVANIVKNGKKLN